MQSVGYFYNLHVNVESFIRCINSVKTYSPGSPIYTFGDHSLSMLGKYTELAKELDIHLIVRDVEMSFIDRNEDIEKNLIKMQEYMNRMYTACVLMEGIKWIIRLEDDVYMKCPIKEYPSSHAAGNHPDFGMGGGSIFNREAFIEIYEKDGPEYIESKCRKDPDNAWAGDGLVRRMFTDHDKTYSRWDEITEEWNNDRPDAAFHHGDKSLYNKEYLKSRKL